MRRFGCLLRGSGFSAFFGCEGVFAACCSGGGGTLLCASVRCWLERVGCSLAVGERLLQEGSVAMWRSGDAWVIVCHEGVVWQRCQAASFCVPGGAEVFLSGGVEDVFSFLRK